MQLEIGQVCSPHQCGNVLCQTELNVILASMAVDRGGLHPVRMMLGAVLLVEVHAVHTLGVTLKRERTILEMRDQHRSNAYKVVNYLSFREADRRIENFVEIRELERLAFDLDYCFLLGHVPIPSLSPNCRIQGNLPAFEIAAQRFHRFAQPPTTAILKPAVV